MKFTSPVFSAVSGSQGGTTYSHNRGGMYTRARAVPTNPNSIRQQANRATMGGGVQNWSEVQTDASRQIWRDYAAVVPVLDKLGQTKYLTGQQMFLRWWVAYTALGGEPGVLLNSIPANTGEGFESMLNLGTVGGNGLGFDVSGAELNTQIDFSSEASANGRYGLFIGPPLNAGRSFFKGPYQLFTRGAITATDTDITIQTSTAELMNANGGLALGQRRGFRLAAAYADGRVAQSFAAVLPVLDGATA